jgi:hypothetical protein
MWDLACYKIKSMLKKTVIAFMKGTVQVCTHTKRVEHKELLSKFYVLFKNFE